jgi:circadian clock protein KaiC
MFGLATAERPALHFTVLGEPPLKLLRYQQQFEFFDSDKVEKIIRYINLSHEVLQRDLGAVLDSIVREVAQANPSVVVVDSFRTVVRSTRSTNNRDVGALELQGFLQQLAMHLTTWQATTFLVGEYLDAEMQDNPVFTVADGIVWLYESVERNSSVRKLRVVKMRGQAPLPGLHTLRITDAGMHVFPRIIKRIAETDNPRPNRRLSTGVAELDEMLRGGIPAWDSVLIAGPSGSGKSALGGQFIAAGLTQGEPGVIAVFEERPKEYLARAKSFGADLDAMTAKGLLEVLYLRPLDLSVDEALLEIQAAVIRVKAERLVIDSLSGFELALAPTFREDFRESLYRMVGALTGAGVTVLMTAEVGISFTDLSFSASLISFLTDNIILQRYVEMDGELTKVLAVVKMRGSDHDKSLRAYELTEHGLVVGEALTDYSGIITGVAHRRSELRMDASSDSAS